MGLAASPTGSIGSRLREDTSQKDPRNAEVEEHQVVRNGSTPVTWRYSTAPQLIAAVDLDVREPLSNGSPKLPEHPQSHIDQTYCVDPEPISSGFTSPATPEEVQSTQRDHDDKDLGEVARIVSQHASTAEDGFPGTISELEQPLTGLRLSGNDVDMVDDETDDSPIIAHLKRRSASEGPPPNPVENDSGFFISQSAQAAGDSARAKRNVLRQLFGLATRQQPPRSRLPPLQLKSMEQNLPCPDPDVHQRHHTTLCPDPSAHYRSGTPNMYAPPRRSMTPAADLAGHVPDQNPMRASLYPPVPPFHRADGSGSPMPLQRHRPPPGSPPYAHGTYHPRSSHYPPVQPPSRMSRPGRPGRPGPPGIGSMASEHFQPGWYYQREAEQGPKSGPLTYAFSTAAGKVVGSSPAPDSMIRDSYRTDTLTPLARPPSRFRKTGAAAIAGTRGVSKYYGGNNFDPQRASPFIRSGVKRGPSTPHDVRFCSSPPRSHDGYPFRPLKRRRTRETKRGHFEIIEDEAVESLHARVENADPSIKTEEGEEMMEVDEETRAAVRMSLYGSELPETLCGAKEGLKELSPNVTPWRKGMSPRKKRRPSYWDSDLEEVQQSAAARQVKTSPTRGEQEIYSNFHQVGATREMVKIGAELDTTLSQLTATKEREATGNTRTIPGNPRQPEAVDKTQIIDDVDVVMRRSIDV